MSGDDKASYDDVSIYELTPEREKELLEKQIEAAGYHAVNVALHALVTWLLFALAARLFSVRVGAAAAAVLPA